MKQFLSIIIAVMSLQLYGSVFPAMAEDGTPGHLGLHMPRELRLAPDFLLKDIEGNLKGLGDYKGKVALIHFWATWCGPCKDELPTINALRERFKDRDFAIIAIAEDSKKTVEPYVKKHGLKFPVLIDQYGKAFRSYGVRALPASYIVNRSGKIEGIALGQRDWITPEIVNFIESLLKDGHSN